MPRMPWPWHSAICRPNKPASASGFPINPQALSCWHSPAAQDRPPHAAQLTTCAAHRKETMKTFLLRFVLLACVASVFLKAPAGAAASTTTPSPASAHAKLSYRRIFKSSSPEFIEIIVHDDSDAAT